jgi:D-serine deaminase-like pyridoxal phosphate-dependent protein
MNALAQRVHLGVLVDSAYTLAAIATGIHAPIDVWLEADTGYQRSGLPVTADETSVLPFAELCAIAKEYPHLTVRGFVSHSGHSYGYGHDGKTLDLLFVETIGLLESLRGRLAALGYDNLEISLGDTPMASVVANLQGADELRPGNFIFYDWMQHAFGSCHESDIAVAVAAPVVANYPARNEVILYAGAVHLGKEMMPHPAGGADYGHIAPLSGTGWGSAYKDVWLRSLSQEHGIVRATPEAYARDLAALKPGDLVAVLPIHSCLTADLLKCYLTLDGRVIEMLHL